VILGIRLQYLLQLLPLLYLHRKHTKLAVQAFKLLQQNYLLLEIRLNLSLNPQNPSNGTHLRHILKKIFNLCPRRYPPF